MPYRQGRCLPKWTIPQTILCELRVVSPPDTGWMILTYLVPLRVSSLRAQSPSPATHPTTLPARASLRTRPAVDASAVDCVEEEPVAREVLVTQPQPFFRN